MTYGDLSIGVVGTKGTQQKKRIVAGIDQAFRLATSNKAGKKFGLRAILGLIIVTTAQGQNFPTVINTVAGGGSSDNVPATSSPVFPSSVVVDGSGNLFIPDAVNNRVRKVDTSGIITTVVGNGAASFSGPCHADHHHRGR